MQIPGLYSIADHSKIDWNYYSVDDGYSSQALKSNIIRIPRGKMLSGSSGNNYLTYTRGNKADYDSWAQQGNNKWDWDAVLPYFKKSERLTSLDLFRNDTGSLHGLDGEIGVSLQFRSDEINKYLEAVQEIGHDYVQDYNGYQQIGYSTPQLTISDGIRQSTGTTYLKTAKDRHNLHVLKNTLARKVIFEGNVVKGVEVMLNDGEIAHFYTNKEVILSAGAYNTPQLLMLSGVGPRKHLKELGIDVLLDSPNVGKNLQDHVMSPVVITGRKGVASIVNNINALSNLNTYPICMIGHIAINKTQEYPDYQVYSYPLPASSVSTASLCTSGFQLEDDTCRTLIKAGLQGESIFSYIALLHPESRGEIKLRSSSPEDAPLIQNGFFRNANDLERQALNFEDFLRIVNTTLLRSYGSEIVDLNLKQCKGHQFGSHEYWKCYVLNTANTEYHPCGTCAMGPKGKGVVDARLKFRGIKNLRVVDASVIPTIVSGNTYAPVVMIAEKASDMIKEDCGIKL